MAHFVRATQNLSAEVTLVASEAAALAKIWDLLGDARQISGWGLARLTLKGLAEGLAARGITLDPGDHRARFSLTGVDAALAATGSLLLTSGPGQPRSASLTAETHIALVQRAQIVPNLEAWIAAQRATGLPLREAANVVIISGPSRTADIAMELVLGAHGPAALSILVLP
ncbi:MAG: LUD domain-containing protein [Anaerolineae bacterium]|nr:LUD domain-containing protein [Anaerolineae bacterium]